MKRVRAQDTLALEDPMAQGDMKAKREMARRLLEGDGVDKDKAKAVSLLEDCVAHGDAVAMVMLAKCCALGHGMEHNAGRAEALVSEAAEKGNDEARILLQLINDWKGKERIHFWGLRERFLKELKENNSRLCCFAGDIKGESMTERVALVMNIVPCLELGLGCQS